MNPSSLESAREFLRAKRIAIAGVSRNPKDFSRMLLRELARRGLDVVPVNPAVQEAEGRPCFPSVKDVRPPADAVLLMTPPARTEAVVRDCIAGGVRWVWFHRGAGPGAATEEAIALCAASGIRIVKDLCPFMALPDAGVPHRVHGFFRRVLSQPPREPSP